jgi:phosphoribosylaminoimidazole carboxylase (NCAIR synthetase)
VTNNAAAQNKTVTDNVDKKVTEAVDALNKGDLSKVLEKVKEANIATKEAEKISDQMVNNVQQLVPVAPIIAATDLKKDVVDVKDIKVIINTSTPASLPTIKVIVPTMPEIKPSVNSIEIKTEKK